MRLVNMGLFRTARNFGRMVGKSTHSLRGIGKAIYGMNRTIAKHTGFDAGAKALEWGGKVIEKRTGVPVNDIYNSGTEMMRQVQGGDYHGAAAGAHRLAKQHHSGYAKQYGRVVSFLDDHNLTGAVQSNFNRYTRR